MECDPISVGSSLRAPAARSLSEGLSLSSLVVFDGTFSFWPDRRQCAVRQLDQRIIRDVVEKAQPATATPAGISGGRATRETRKQRAREHQTQGREGGAGADRSGELRAAGEWLREGPRDALAALKR